MQFYSGSERLPVVSTDALTFNRRRFYLFRLVNDFTCFKGPCFLRIFVRERIVHSGNMLCRIARLLLDGNAFESSFRFLIVSAFLARVGLNFCSVILMGDSREIADSIV